MAKSHITGIEGNKAGRRVAHLPGNCRTGTRPPASAAKALELFSQYILQHDLIQCQVRHQPLQPRVLLLNLFEPTNLIHLQPYILPSPLL